MTDKQAQVMIDVLMKILGVLEDIRDSGIKIKGAK